MYETDDLTRINMNQPGLGREFIMRYAIMVRKRLGWFKGWLNCTQCGDDTMVMGDGTTWYRLEKIADKDLVAQLNGLAQAHERSHNDRLTADLARASVEVRARSPENTSETSRRPGPRTLLGGGSGFPAGMPDISGADANQESSDQPRQDENRFESI